jgi:peptide/nickel transport system substrate-binding protein
MARFARLIAAALAAVALVNVPAPRPAAAAEGQMAWDVHITLVPTYFDPAETQGLVTPFMLRYALHDALVKPMPYEDLTLKNR